jgi:hypothetical protein
MGDCIKDLKFVKTGAIDTVCEVTQESYQIGSGISAIRW